MKRIALLFLVCLLLTVSGPAVADRQLVLTFLGDCTLGCSETMMPMNNCFYKTAEQKGYAFFFAGVSELLAGDDCTIANFEGVLQDTDSEKADKHYNFRGLPAFARILTLGSVEAVTLSNNHTDDYGDGGRQATRDALAAEGIAAFDSQAVYTLERSGVRIAFLGIWQDQWIAGRKQIFRTIEDLKADGVGAVAVYMHAGSEGSPLHIGTQTGIAHALIDAGADLVVGSHPHVIQGAEVYQSRLILYSLGNFVFGGNARVSAIGTIIPRLTLSFSDSGDYTGIALRLYPAHVSDDPLANHYQPCLVTGEEAEAVYALFNRDSAGAGAPTLETQTGSYRDYRPISAAGY